MTLRARVAIAFAAVLAVLVAAFTTTIIWQQSVMIDQLDRQLEAISGNVARLPTGALGETAVSRLAADGQQRTPPSSDLFIGIVDSDGSMQVIARPLSEPDFVPVLPDELDSLPNQPVTTPSVAGGPGARTVVADLGAGRTGVFSISTRAVEEASRQLIVTSLIALSLVVATLLAVAFWLDRLGLTPIKRITRAAEEVAAGRSEQRVDHPPSTTEAGRLGVAFNTMLDARQEAERRQRQFVADASHELRTPITALLGYTSLYQQGGFDSPDQIDDAMRRIGSEGKRLSALVEDLLTLAAVDDGRPLNRTTVDLTRLLADIAADAAVIQPERHVAAEIAEGLQAELDEHLITQAVTTLVSNSLRHTPPTSPLTVTATSTAAVRAAAGRDGDRTAEVSIEVIDGGPGIPTDRLEHVFDRFNRADSGRSRSSGGTGLGLSIARSIVVAHGGRIAIDSSVEHGTRVTIDLPAGGPPPSGSHQERFKQP